MSLLARIGSDDWCELALYAWWGAWCIFHQPREHVREDEAM